MEKNIAEKINSNYFGLKFDQQLEIYKIYMNILKKMDSNDAYGYIKNMNECLEDHNYSMSQILELKNADIHINKYS